MKSIKEANIFKGLRVLVRADLDVPIENGKILEPYRLEQSLPTLKYIIEKQGFPVIIGHIGKPDGKFVSELSTKQLASFYDEKLGADNYELLENLRFDPGEEKNDPDFVKKISQYGAIYVNDSFAVCHRKHASIVGLPSVLTAYAGIELANEVDALNKVLTNPQRPLVAIVGGAKIESKLPTITNLLQIADMVLAGGRIGLEWKEEIPSNLLVPEDYAENQKDIGPKTSQHYAAIVNEAKTIVWAGPMGAYENDEFMQGTKELTEAVAQATENGAFSVIGGGDTIAAVNKTGLLNKISFVSTGGGAMLEFLAKGTLEGVKALK
ncbi:phosphoglycerate kinase [candidate division WWE3 bacterium]|uniref:Phosphoglycerate kinase n=1 Tax=candidate division WWE3 bacterium TaxID=2053526 RepID=A0A7X9HGY0_UNCKA|nr:phosphoglycerate kinase [candidate division WWE3 bacterium]